MSNATNNANALPVSVSTAFATYKDREGSRATLAKAVADAAIASLETTNGVVIGAGAAFAQSLVTAFSDADAIGAALNTLGFYAFCEETGRAIGPMPSGKKRTASVYYGESPLKPALHVRGFSLSFADGVITCAAIAKAKEAAKAKKEKAEKEAKEAKEKEAKEAKDAHDKALADALKDRLSVSDLPACIAALVAFHGMDAVAAHIAGQAKAAKKAAKAA